MKWFLLVFCGLFFVAGIWQMNLPETSTAQHASVPAVVDVNSDLQEENRKLREQIAALSSEVVQLKRASANNALQKTNTEPPKKTDKNVLVKEVHIQAQIQEFNDALTNGEGLGASVKNNFANEPVDSAWANLHRQELEKFFEDSFDNIFPQYIECRSTRCKITIPTIYC